MTEADKAERIAKIKADNHYTYLEAHFDDFLEALDIDRGYGGPGMFAAHGDKAYQYRGEWEAKGIPFFHGVSIILLTYIPKYSSEVRATPNGWVAPHAWVIANYDKGHKFLEQLSALENS